MIERVKAIMSYYNLSVNAFANKIGANQVTLNQQMNGDRKISIDTVSKIANSFELISIDWIVTGRGKMLQEEISSDERISNKNSTINDRLIYVIESQQRTIESMQEQIKKMLAQTGSVAICASASGFELGK